MVIQLENKKVYVVNNMDDIKDLVDPEIFEAIEYFQEQALQEQYDKLYEEFEEN